MLFRSLFSLTFGYVGGANHTLTFGYNRPSKTPTIGYIGGTNLPLTFGYSDTLM